MAVLRSLRRTVQDGTAEQAQRPSRSATVVGLIGDRRASGKNIGGKSLPRFAAERGGAFFPYTIPLTAPPRGGREPIATGEGNALPG
jgi:hypothetical protein